MVGERQVEGAGADYQEYVVLDSAGRLQVPRDHLEQFGFGDRATLEVIEDGILIRPVTGNERVIAPLVADLEEAEPAPRQRGLRGWWARRRRG